MDYDKLIDEAEKYIHTAEVPTTGAFDVNDSNNSCMIAISKTLLASLEYLGDICYSLKEIERDLENINRSILKI